jgi:hypothetical protein
MVCVVCACVCVCVCVQERRRANIVGCICGLHCVGVCVFLHALMYVCVEPRLCMYNMCSYTRTHLYTRVYVNNIPELVKCAKHLSNYLSS